LSFKLYNKSVPSILIYGGSLKTRKDKAHELLNQHYIHHLEAVRGRIGIGQVKELLPHLYIKPPKGKKRGVLILEAQQMTHPAQNSILKTLEEPPTFLTFVLTTPHPKLLLPTVISRCFLKVVEEGEREQTNLTKKILLAKPGERLFIFEQQIGYGPEAALKFLDSMELELAQLLTNNKDIHPTTAKLKRVWETKELLRKPSINVKLVVDQLLISW